MSPPPAGYTEAARSAIQAAAIAEHDFAGWLAGVLAAGPVDLLAGGPPCPPYSKSRFYRSDKPRALDDPVGDATLNGYRHERFTYRQIRDDPDHVIAVTRLLANPR